MGQSDARMFEPPALPDSEDSSGKWWEAEPSENAWLETTDREQLGIDLSAPQGDERGHEHHGYSLVTLVRKGDVVFHYHKDHRGIVGYSIATGVVWEQNIVWAAQCSARGWHKASHTAGLASRT